MEFDELKKIWDTQNHQSLYAIDEEALHRRILAKQRQAYHITNTSELLLIFVNLAGGSFILGMNVLKHGENLYLYLLATWMVGCALYVLMSRLRRIKGNSTFDRSLRSDLAYAISLATYQVRISQLGWWNIVPMGTLLVLGTWSGGKSVWVVAGLLLFLVLTTVAARWEHNGYKARKRELEALQNKLETEDTGIPF